MERMSGVELLVVVVICGIIVFLSGCSFRVEALYHGETPIGLQNTQATALRADADKPKTKKDY